MYTINILGNNFNSFVKISPYLSTYQAKVTADEFI